MINPHVYYIPRWYPSKEDPMLGLFVAKHAKAAVKAGFRVSVAYVCPLLINTENKKFEIRVNRDNNLLEVTVAYANAEGFKGILRQTFAWIKALHLVYKLEGKPDLIHAHILTRTAVLAFLCGLRYRVPFLITEHWSRYFNENMQYKGRIRHLLTRFVLKHAEKVTVVSERLARGMKSCGLKFEPVLLPNIVDTELFIPKSQPPENRKKIISITCFDEKSKNLFMLIDAFKLLFSQNDEVELVLVGEGRDLEMTKQYVLNSGLAPGKVTFTGKLENNELVEELQTGTCLALSSNYETFAIVIFEALACGIPVVATDVADLGKHITPEMGRVVPTGDVVAFKDKLAEVIENEQLFPREIMRSYVIRNFGPEAITDRLRQLYISLLQKKQND